MGLSQEILLKSAYCTLLGDYCSNVRDADPHEVSTYDSPLSLPRLDTEHSYSDRVFCANRSLINGPQSDSHFTGTFGSFRLVWTLVGRITL